MKPGLLLVLLAACLLPGASADAAIEGPVVVHVDDQRPEDCTPTLVEACLVTIPSSGAPGEQTVDLHHSIRRVDVAANPAYVAPAAGILPAYAILLQGNSTFASFALVEAAMDLYASVPQDRPGRDALGLRFDREAAAVYYYGPPLQDPQAEHANRSTGLALDDADGGWVSSDQLGPMNSGAVTTTDVQAGPLPLLVCDIVDPSQSCYHAALGVQQTYNDTTPNVILGFEWDVVALATDPGALEWAAAASANESTPERGVAPDRTASLALWARAAPAEAGRPPEATTDPVPHRPVHRPPVAPPAAVEIATASMPESPVGPLPTMVAIGAGLSLGLVLSGLYSRFASKHALLAHPVRAALMTQVARRPGVSFCALQDIMNLNRSTLQYHLRLLERERCVRLANVNQTLRVFLPGQSPSAGADAELEHPTRGQILAALASAPLGLTRAELHAAVPAMPLRTRNHTIARLTEMGLIRSESFGGLTRFTIAHAVEGDARSRAH